MTGLRGRLFFSMVAAVVASLALTVAFGVVLTRRTSDRNELASLARRADLLARQATQRPTYVTERYRVGALRVRIERRSLLQPLVPATGRESSGKMTVDGTRFLFAYRPAGPRGVLVLRPASLGSTEWRPFLRDLLLAGLVASALAAALAFVLARSIVRPVRRVAAASRALAAGASPEPLPTDGPAELASLAQAFNEMAEQLAASREAERNFLLSVSHELKTPLTAIRGYAEGLADGAFSAEEAAATIGVEARRLERLVRDILDLARMNRREFAVRREPVELLDVAREVVARHEAAAREFGVGLAAEGDEAWVEADHDRVVQAASNLVENALRETPRGGRVVVRAAPGHLAVSDTGPGLAEQDLPHAFDRFYLYDKASRDRRVGSGLGLAIVKQLAVAMGGNARVESRPGEGATFAVDLPSERAMSGLRDRTSPIGTGASHR